MAPGHMTLSRRWISMMTGSCPKKRFKWFYISYAVILFILLHFSQSLCIQCPNFNMCYLLLLFCHSSCTQQVKEYLKKEFEKHGYSHNDTHHELMVDDIFRNEDEDKDGFISTREFVYQHDELWTVDLKMCVIFLSLWNQLISYTILTVCHTCL